MLSSISVRKVFAEKPNEKNFTYFLGSRFLQNKWTALFILYVHFTSWNSFKINPSFPSSTTFIIFNHFNHHHCQYHFLLMMMIVLQADFYLLLFTSSFPEIMTSNYEKKFTIKKILNEFCSQLDASPYWNILQSFITGVNLSKNKDVSNLPRVMLTK